MCYGHAEHTHTSLPEYSVEFLAFVLREEVSCPYDDDCEQEVPNEILDARQELLKQIFSDLHTCSGPLQDILLPAAKDKVAIPKPIPHIEAVQIGS